MPTLIIALFLIVIVVLVVRHGIRQQLFHKAHPSLEERQRALTRAFSMDDAMTPEEYEKELDLLLRSKHGQ